LEERSEVKGISPILSKSKVKRIGVFQKFAKMKQNEVKHSKIEQDRSKTNVFVSYCEEEGKQTKNEASFFSGKKQRKTNTIIPQLLKICHC
jgi:hypothetical protein